MNIKELRNSIGVKQGELVAALNKEGIKANKADISRIENGIIETYLYLAFRAEEILKGKISPQKGKSPSEAKFRSCNSIPEIVYERIRANGYTDYDDLSTVLGESDKRRIRKAVQDTRCEYPLIDREGGGWALATTIADCNKQIGIYEKKKRVYSYQETPLIAKKYEMEKELANG